MQLTLENFCAGHNVYRMPLWSTLSKGTLQHTATHCNTLQNTLQHSATHCNTGGRYDVDQHGRFCPFLYISTLRHTATHCKRLQKIATHYNALQHTATQEGGMMWTNVEGFALFMYIHIATHCNTLQHCKTLQHSATHCNTSGRYDVDHHGRLCPFFYVSTLQHTATYCNAL